MNILRDAWSLFAAGCDGAVNKRRDEFDVRRPGESGMSLGEVGDPVEFQPHAYGGPLCLWGGFGVAGGVGEDDDELGEQRLSFFADVWEFRGISTGEEESITLGVLAGESQVRGREPLHGLRRVVRSSNGVADGCEEG